MAVASLNISTNKGNASPKKAPMERVKERVNKPSSLGPGQARGKVGARSSMISIKVTDMKRGGGKQQKRACEDAAAITSGDDSEPGGLSRRGSSKGERGSSMNLNVFLRPPRYIWKPSSALLRDLVKLASRLASPAEAEEAFKA